MSSEHPCRTEYHRIVRVADSWFMVKYDETSAFSETTQNASESWATTTGGLFLVPAAHLQCKLLEGGKRIFHNQLSHLYYLTHVLLTTMCPVNCGYSSGEHHTPAACLGVRDTCSCLLKHLCASTADFFLVLALNCISLENEYKRAWSKM